ncbi:MAG: aminotransferase class III-fold pyridoxal phosphate-dependent enzyme, partial [Nitrospirota bacterium]
MKILQIGAGSMGKRRIRNLFALGFKDVIGFDLREDRRNEVAERYHISTIDKLTPDILSERDIFIISTPPDRHLEYMWLAVQHGKPAFVEASVIKKGIDDLLRTSKEKNILIAPSCTFRFHPSIKVIKEIVSTGKYGKISNFIYYMGQYLPDWHPWENIKDFYAGKRETSASREMVPFELTWLLDITGMPEEVFSLYGKTHDMGVDIDDTYNINLRFDGFLGTMAVDVVSRFATRSLILNLEMAQIRWNWEEKVVKLYDADKGNWIYFYEPEGQRIEDGYNKNIIEEMYVEEINTFINAVRGIKPFPNTLYDDINILTILEKAEQTNHGIAINSPTPQLLNSSTPQLNTGIKLYKRAKKIIPGGTQLLSKRPEMFLPGQWPSYYSRCKGAEVWDMDGNKFIDMSICGVGSTILGYADQDVDNAVKKAVEMGTMCTLNCPEEVELAELLSELHPWSDMVRFARGGGEAMAVAIRIARAATGREKIAFCGYHGWHDWYLSANIADDKNLDRQLLTGLKPAGVPVSLKKTAIPFNYNKSEELDEIAGEYGKEIAAIVMEPVRHYEPDEGFLQLIRKTADRIGAVLIFDEVTSGWRMNVGGIHLIYEVNPDIAVFAKGISNGYPMAAIIGIRDV